MNGLRALLAGWRTSGVTWLQGPPQGGIKLLIFPLATLLMFTSREVLRLYGAAYLPGNAVLAGFAFW